MIYSIDYYAYTIPTESPFIEGMFYDQQETVLNIFRTSLPVNEHSHKFVDGWQHEHIHKHYQHRLRHTATDVCLSYGRKNAHVYVEFAGKACNALESIDILLLIILGTNPRCSRIDFAVDVECQISPAVFISQRHNKSFKSSGNKYSPTGGTEYIGGRTSDRMARVYRYNEPHPRHKLLRVEAEFKGDAAKATAKFLSETDVQTACLSAHQIFGWKHEVWQPDQANISKVPYKSYSPSTASTIEWLYGDVVTALRKAIRKDIIDFEDWLKYVRQGLF